MTLIIFLLVSNYLVTSVCSVPLAPALYGFGDSLFDSGNNNLLPTLAKANFLPYGINFAKGATGRFSNGRILPDFVAEFLRLPYAPPYMSVRKSTTLTGLNYASGSCGILPETGSLLGKCLNLHEQVDLFQHTVKLELPKHFKNTNQLLKYLSKSVFVFNVGSNDYLNNYLQTGFFNTSKRYTPQAFAQLLVDALSRHFERMYNLGARKIVMFEIGPLGCSPSIAREHRHPGKCVQETNLLVSYFNNKLQETLKNLTSTLRGSIFTRGRVNWLVYDAIINPSRYGLKEGSNPCCTTWLNGTSACIPLLKPCPNPNNHFFFDAFHLTEGAFSVVAAHCINDTSVCSPTVKELVKM